MKTMMILALACLPLNTQTSGWDNRMEHKPLPSGPRQTTYPQDALHALQQGIQRQRSVSDIAQQFGGSAKGTLRRTGKPANLPPQTQQHAQPSAPQPPAYHEWLPLSPTSPSSQDSYRSSSACSDQGLEVRTVSYTEEPTRGWVSPSTPAVHPSAPPLEMGIPYVQGEETLPDEVQRAIKDLRTQDQAFAALVEAARRRGKQLIINRVKQQTAKTPKLTKWPFEAQEHLKKRERDALDTARTKATDKIGDLTHAMRVICKDFPVK